jgi:hypothetical protein
MDNGQQKLLTMFDFYTNRSDYIAPAMIEAFHASYLERLEAQGITEIDRKPINIILERTRVDHHTRSAAMLLDQLEIGLVQDSHDSFEFIERAPADYMQHMQAIDEPLSVIMALRLEDARRTAHLARANLLLDELFNAPQVSFRAIMNMDNDIRRHLSATDCPPTKKNRLLLRYARRAATNRIIANQMPELCL